MFTKNNVKQIDHEQYDMVYNNGLPEVQMHPRSYM